MEVNKNSESLELDVNDDRKLLITAKESIKKIELIKAVDLRSC